MSANLYETDQSENLNYEVYELEAVPPKVLQAEVRKLIVRLLDRKLYNRECEIEVEEFKRVKAMRETIKGSLSY